MIRYISKVIMLFLTVLLLTGCMLGTSLAATTQSTTSAKQTAAAAPAKPGSQLVDIEFREAEVLDIYQVLGDLAGWNVVADQSVKGKASFVLHAIPLSEALDLVARTTGFNYTLVGNTLVVGSASSLKGFAQQDFVLLPIRFLTPNTAKELMLAGVPNAQITVDDQQRVALVRGTSDQIKQAAAILAQYDVSSSDGYDFVDQPVAEILRTLAKAAGLNVMVMGELPGKLTLFLKDMSPRDAISMVAARAGVTQELSPEGVLILRPAQGAEIKTQTDPLETRIFQPQYITVGVAVELMTASIPSLELKPSQSGAFIVAKGTVADLDAAKSLLDWNDFPTVRLTGLVQFETGIRAVLEIAGKTYVIKEGQQVGELLVESVAPEGVRVRRNDRVEFIATGGAL